MAKRMKSAYSLGELAKLLGWSKQRVVRWLTANDIRCIKIGKQGKTIVPVEELFGANFSLLHHAVSSEDDDD